MRLLYFISRWTLCKMGWHIEESDFSLYRRPSVGSGKFRFFEQCVKRCVYCGVQLDLSEREIDVGLWWKQGINQA